MSYCSFFEMTALSGVNCVMNTKPLNLRSQTGLLNAVPLALAVAARCADAPTLKDACRNHSQVGVAEDQALTELDSMWKAETSPLAVRSAGQSIWTGLKP
jgi:hypothetical protein